MAMALYPQVQKKAQAELDRVLDGRLPEFNDRPNLPYINAMIKESARWQSVTPLGHIFFRFQNFKPFKLHLL
jgi:cytochrome P450